MRLTLIICHIRPRTRWGRPSMRSTGPIFTTLQPMEEAELMASVWFSCIVKVLSFPLLIALSSTVPATEVLISLLREKRGEKNQEQLNVHVSIFILCFSLSLSLSPLAHQRTKPSLTASKRPDPSSDIGNTLARSASFSSWKLIQSTKANFSSSANE